jgi:hypothetical protein
LATNKDKDGKGGAVAIDNQDEEEYYDEEDDGAADGQETHADI